MCIDICARWKGQTPFEERAQVSEWLSPTGGRAGYLRETCHGESYATKYLCAEAFKRRKRQARIRAAVLRARLPHTLTLVEQRERTDYEITDEAEIEWLKEIYREFVALCERKEKETGEPVVIV